MPMNAVAIIDYGRGNVRSVANAIDYCGADAVVTADPKVIDDATHIILPGVGAFGDAMAALNKRELTEVLRRQVFEKGKPFFGVCLGMQLLAERSAEHGEHTGLGWIAGDIVRLSPGLDVLKIPHMGWNNIIMKRPHPLFDHVEKEHLNFYFVHSYCFSAQDSESVVATCEYGSPFAAVVARDNIIAAQFHPEKSQDSGIDLLEKFIAWSP